MRSQDSSDSRIHLSLDHLSGGVIAVDPSTTITYLTAATARTLAPQPETARGKPLATFLGCAATEALRLHEIFAGQPYVNGGGRVAPGHREPCCIGFSASPCRDPDGTITGTVISSREIGSTPRRGG